MITIDLNSERPGGRYQTTTRWQKHDREVIQEAAMLIGMSAAEFIRTVTYQAAERVIAWDDKERARENEERLRVFDQHHAASYDGSPPK